MGLRGGEPRAWLASHCPLLLPLLPLPSLSSSPFCPLLLLLQFLSIVTYPLDKQMVSYLLLCLACATF